MSEDSIPNAHELDYQYGKTLDVWSGALWLGSALGALEKLASQGDELAQIWMARVPGEVKARWPGIFGDVVTQSERQEDR